MNVTAFRLRYGIAAIVSALAAKDFGPVGIIVSFVVFNALWTLGEEALIARHSLNQTAKWKREKGK